MPSSRDESPRPDKNNDGKPNGRDEGSRSENSGRQMVPHPQFYGASSSPPSTPPPPSATGAGQENRLSVYTGPSSPSYFAPQHPHQHYHQRRSYYGQQYPFPRPTFEVEEVEWTEEDQQRERKEREEREEKEHQEFEEDYRRRDRNRIMEKRPSLGDTCRLIYRSFSGRRSPK